MRALVVSRLRVRGGGGGNGPLGRERGGAGPGRRVVVLHAHKQAGRRYKLLLFRSTQQQTERGDTHEALLRVSTYAPPDPGE